MVADILFVGRFRPATAAVKSMQAQPRFDSTSRARSPRPAWLTALVIVLTFAAGCQAQPGNDTVDSALAGYFFPYFTGEGSADGEQIYFALSRGDDPLRYDELYRGRPVLSSPIGTTGLRDPFVIRSPGGDRFFLLATDLKMFGNGDWDAAQRHGSRSFVVFESTDLATWTDPRLVEVSPPTAGNTWAPEAYYDDAIGAYVVFWASQLYAESDPDHTGQSYNRMLYSTTSDFVTFSEARIWIDPGHAVIDSTVIEHDGIYYRFTKDERAATPDNPCGKFITGERSESLLATNYELIDDCIGRPGIVRGEGPTIFKSNSEERWYLFIDEFGGRGYVPFTTTDLDATAEQWTLAADYELPGRPRHGTVLPITAAEHARLVAAFGSERTEYAAYFFPHFVGESTPDGEAIYFAVSDGNDPMSWQTLNGGSAVLTSTLGTRGLRDPFIIRSPDGGRFFLLATDLQIYGGGNFGDAQETGSRSLMIWESTDLVNWGEQREVVVAPANAGNVWAPEAYWDANNETYMVYWASALYPADLPAEQRDIATSYQRMLHATTSDFVTFSEPRVWIDEPRGPGRGMIDSTIAEEDGIYYRLTKDESYYGMRQESSTDLRLTQGVDDGDGWMLITERVGFGQPNPWGGTFTGGEGPTIFRSIGGDTWYLLQDQPSYHGGEGYVLFQTDDLASGRWTSIPEARLPASPRHGTVIPVTEAEYGRLLAAFDRD
jgi:sucrose-6-phosphate hydrolase SacC (GH32 family)